ncbi:ABC transporter substrate-binding protein [Nocardia panacis]|uniref:ABC transporter substrate-binding protein n=1 Tax=Nocardia panacis TaxID=2340916 RepID=A0A3A4KIY2_9NOCA|nr:transporter substrate-binding domain-containing protein [Nocardia panacis]RJO69123.1 ABC transporter substrate-binding protein [Nocardia panacis]
MRLSAMIAVTAAALLLAGCGGPDPDTKSQNVEAAGFDLSPAQAGRVRAPKVDAIAAAVPQAIRDRGALVVIGTAGSAPPLRFHATDDKTVVGIEVDISALIADILGLRAQQEVADWSQSFVRVDSGAADAMFSNVTVTEERKEKYDFATYRSDTLALEVPIASTLEFQDRKSLAGKRIGVGTGTNQEQLLVEWNRRNLAEGLAPIDIAYFKQVTDYYLALASQRLDGYLGPNPTAVYHATVAKQTKVLGTFSGAGEQLQGEIAVLTKKDNGLIGPIHQALEYAIQHGLYQQTLDRWKLHDEAVTTSRINPPGLPKK